MTLLNDNNFPPRNLETDEEIIEYVDEHQVSGLHNQGYEWFWSVYMPALARVVDADEIDDETIANNFYVVGDVHDFNDSPRTAITYYKAALDFNPEMNAAHREIAKMYHRLGFIDAAIHHSDQALALWPDEKNAVADRKDIDADKNHTDPCYEKADRPAALAVDALAKQNPKEAIRLLEGLKDLESLKVLTWAHGANQDIPAYLSAWKAVLICHKKIAETKTELSLFEKEFWFKFADFFFMPDKVWDDSEIWKIFMMSGLKFSGVSLLYEGLDDTECDIAIDINFSKLSSAEKYAQRIEYLYYLNSNNLDGLKSIQLKYPNWVELNEKIEMLENPNP